MNRADFYLPFYVIIVDYFYRQHGEIGTSREQLITDTNPKGDKSHFIEYNKTLI